MELTTISANLSQVIVNISVLIFSIYIFLLGWFPSFRQEVNELLSEIFDASMTDEEKVNLGPAIVLPVVAGLTLLGFVFMMINIKAALIPMGCLIVAALFTASRRRAELKRKVLDDLAKIEL